MLPSIVYYKKYEEKKIFFLWLLFFLSLFSVEVKAQSITPAADGTGTIVNGNGKRFDIKGGTLSGNGGNLFHSFDQFSLSSGQIANFLPNSDVRNILGRVTGGNASVINGLIQITGGGNPNLFLMNPAGIVFGPNASLNVPASFTATSATGIALKDNSGKNNWFNATGGNNYADLGGIPSELAFNLSQPGSIINAGNLAVKEGQNLSLIGGNIINSGTLSSSGGNVNIAAVPGTSLVKITQPGYLLSLEVDPTAAASGINPKSLPELLTGSCNNCLTGVKVDQAGKVVLEGSGIAVNQGDVAVTGKVTAASATLSAANNLILETSQLQTGGDLNLLAQNQVLIRDSLAKLFVANAGGNLTIQGNTGIDILALNHLETTPFTSGGNLNLISDGLISADAHFKSNGNMSILNLAGSGGKLTNLYDPIFITTGDWNLGTYSGVSLKVQAGGNISSTGIKITDKSIPIPGTDPDIPTLTNSAALILYAGGNINVAGDINITAPASVTKGPVTLWATVSVQTGNITSSGGAISLLSSTGTISTTALNSSPTSANVSTAGNINLQAAGNVSTAGITASGASTGSGGNVNITSSNGTIITGNVLTTNGVAAGAGSRGGNVNFNALGAISTGSINTNDISNISRATTSAGSISLSSSTGGITTNGNPISAASTNNAGNNITLNAAGDIATNLINSDGFLAGGNVTITSSSGAITTRGIVSSSSDTGNGGSVTLAANGNISGEWIYTNASTGNGGDIKVTTSNGSVALWNLLSFAGVGNAGVVAIAAKGDVALTGTAFYSYSNGGNGGNFTLLSSSGNISIPFISTYGSRPGSVSGDVNLQAAGSVRVTDIVPSSNTSIITLGPGNALGKVTISYGGTSPFYVNTTAQPTATSSGTVGIINAGVGADRINGPTSFVNNTTGGISINRTLLGPNIPAPPITPGLPPAAPATPLGVDSVSFNSVGKTAIIPSSLLWANDPNISPATVTYTITPGGLPKNGQLLKNGVALAEGATFSQQDINNGLITYLPKTNTTTSDKFNFTVNYGSGTAGVNSFVLTLTPPPPTTPPTNPPITNPPITNPPTTNPPTTNPPTTGGTTTGGTTTGGTNTGGTTTGGTNTGGTNTGGTTTGGTNTGGTTTGGTNTGGTNTGGTTTGGTNTGGTTTGGTNTGGTTTGGTNTGGTNTGGTTTGGTNTGGTTTGGTNTGGTNTGGTFTSEMTTSGTAGGTTTGAIAPSRVNVSDVNKSPEQPTNSSGTSNSLSPDLENKVTQTETVLTKKFENYLGLSNTPIATLDQAQATLSRIEQATNFKSTFIYATFVDEQLELMLVTSSGKPILRRVEGADRTKVLQVAEEFQQTVTNARNRRGYLPSAQQLYQWLIAPIEKDLQARGINNLAFIMDTGLRSIPLAALHDGQGFIVEKYSVGLMPTLSLTDTRYVDIRNMRVLAMGADKFPENNPLPSVPVELETITNKLWQGKSFLNNTFTLENLKEARKKEPFGIIHLATHGDFQTGDISRSFIQLWDKKLPVNEMRKLGLNNPPVELLVLSACRTALGDEQVELGFAGFAVSAGVKSALGSLWYVSDEGTLGLMTEFYKELKQAPIKAEALRRAQLAMLRGEVRLKGGKLIASRETISLPSPLAQMGDRDLSHPYYWSAFTLIGNPW
ncbi:MAG: CHAT domain-containing protein [Potamolinea sp.]